MKPIYWLVFKIQGGRGMAANPDGSKFRGVGTALITPFDKHGDVDEVAMEWLIERQIEAGISFLVPSGTTGEAPCLSHREQMDLNAFVVRTVNGRVPVVAGTGSNNTAEAARLTRAAFSAGADGALLTSPYYNKPMSAGFHDYYKCVAEAGLPVILYDIPGRTAKSVPLDVILELRDGGYIAGIKWASGDLEQLKAVVNGAPEGFSVLSGDDDRTLELMTLGGHGVISVLSNLLPVQMARMVKAADNKDWDEAKRRHEDLSPLMKAMFIETNPQPIKTAMSMVHPEIIWQRFRSPMMPMEPANQEKLLRVLQEYNLVGVR